LSARCHIGQVAEADLSIKASAIELDAIHVAIARRRLVGAGHAQHSPVDV
jgi:hypothetical protein